MPFGTEQAWGVILPVEKVNLLRNPSVERNTTDWNDPLALGIARTSAVQTHGAFAVRVPSFGAGTQCVGIGPWTAGVGTAYTLSVDLQSSSSPILFGVTNGADVTLATFQGSTSFTIGGGTWQRYSLSYTEASGGGDRYMMIAQISSGGGGSVNIDGAMVEVGSLTTYIDGDQDGCYWTGQPHLSPSVRSGTARQGGTVVALADLGFRPEITPGIGMPPLETTAQSFALLDGAQFQRQRAKERTFTLAGFVQGTATQTRASLHAQRQVLIDALKIDLVSPQQPTRFWYVGGRGTVQVDAVLDAGLGFDLSIGKDGFTESPGIRFIAYDPFFYSTTDQGTALAARTSLGSTNFVAWRDPLGRWGTTGSNGTSVNLNTGGEAIHDLLFNNGTLFLAGNFGTAAGTAAPRVAMYRPASNTYGTLTGGTIGGVNAYALAISPAGSLFVGGDFTTAGGTRAVNVTFWNGGWGTLVGGTITPAGGVHDLVYSGLGTLFLAGDFVTVAGTTSPLIAMWTGAAYGTLRGGGTVGQGVVNIIHTLALDLRNTLYFAGDIGSAGGTPVNNIAFWSNNSFGSMGLGMQGAGVPTVYALAVGANNVIYAGGLFGTAGGGSVSNIAQWTGAQWFPMAQGLGTTAGGIMHLTPMTNGDLFIGGVNLVSAGAGGRPLPDDMARWNGYTYVPWDIDLPSGGGGTIRGIFDTGGTLWIASGFAGTARAASVTRVVNTGRTDTYPILVMRNTSSGTARAYQFVNTLTGDAIYFDLSLLPGEEATLDLTQLSRTFTSSFRGNIFSRILAGSNIAAWRLAPGTNWVSFFADNDSLVASLYWRPRSWSADAGTAL